MEYQNNIVGLVQHQLQEFCERRVPAHIRDQVRLSFSSKGDTITLYEERVHFRDSSKWTKSSVAQFRFEIETKEWMLYCSDRNSRWHIYDLAKPTKDFLKLIKIVDEDSTGIFWG